MLASATATRRSARRAGAVLLSLVLVANACSRDGFEDRTAVVEVGDQTVHFEIDSCGLDETTLFVVGRSDAGEVLQAVVGLEDDGSTGDPAATGATVEVGPDTYAAFGSISWSLREGPGSAPGSIAWSRLRGARVQLSGDAELVDEADRPVTGADARSVPLRLDARCDERADRAD